MSPGLEQDNVARHHLGRGYPRLCSRAHDRRFGDHGLCQGLHGLDRLGLLDEAYDRIDYHNTEDDPGVHPFLEQGRDEPGRQKDIDQGLVELQEKPEQGALALLSGQDIITEALAPVVDFEEVKAPLTIAFQEIDHLVGWQVVPVFPDQFIHDVPFSPVF